MTQTIAERLPNETMELAKKGFPNIAALARFHTTFAEIDKLLGYAGATHHWFSGGSSPQKVAERLAGIVLKTYSPKDNVAADPKHEPAQPQDDNILMVVCPPAKLEKVQKILALMGCEVEAI